MALTETPICAFDTPAPDFALKNIDDRILRFDDVAGPAGTLIVFMCNHCPYVKAIYARLVTTVDALTALGIGVAGIMPNDVIAYPEDDFAHMQQTARDWGLNFPYLIDEDQAVAKAYGAVCTPDFFGYNSDRGLQYRGRLDAGRKAPPTPKMPNELLAAMTQIAATGRGPAEQTPSMGCSIKWRANH